MNFNKVLALFTECKYHIRENKRKLKLKLTENRMKRNEMEVEDNLRINRKDQHEEGWTDCFIWGK